MHRFATAAAALVGTLVATGLAGCKSTPFSADAAASALGTHWFDEENQVYATCSALGITKPADAAERASLSAAFSPAKAADRAQRIANELRAEIEEGLGAVLKSLEVEADACQPAALLASSLGGAPIGEPCRAKLEDAMKKTLPEAGAKIRTALRKAGFVDASSILRDPLRVARLVDFSPAAVSAFVGLAKHAETSIDDVLRGLDYPVVGAVARGVTRELAADAIAAGLDLFVEKLEASTLVRAPSLARRACELYPAAQQHAGLVTVRGLKRLILRFDPGVKPSHAPSRACGGGGVPRELCAKVQRAGSGDDSKTAPSAPTLPAAPRPATTSTVAGAQARLEAATRFCSLPSEDGTTKKEARVECTFDYLSAVVSVLETYRLDANTSASVVRDRLLEVTARLDELKSSLDTVRSELDDVRGMVTGAAAADAAEAARNDALQKKTLALLVAVTSCRGEYDKVVAARIAEVSRLGLQSGGAAVPADACTSLPANAVFARSLGATRIETTQASVCDVFGPLQLAIATDGAFDECAPSPDPVTSEAVEQLARSLCDGAAAGSEPHLVLIGHTDQQPLGEACKKATGFTSNLPLSIARANGIAQSVSRGFGARCGTGKLEVLGWGEARPIRPDCHVEDKACHAVNRRVTVELVDGLGSTMQLEKCVVTPPTAAPAKPGPKK